LRVTIAARARKMKASGEAKLEAELVFGADVLVDVLVLELVVEALVADGPLLVTDVVVKLLVGRVVDAVVVRVLPEVVDPDVVEVDAEALAAPPVNANCSL